ncbi:Wzz/FepE/Etk N-terminal domain-containing protein [Thauera sp.]|uniref:Wzz/FepE/Etk N-terminal domain-containing protein n=1 Tax=Thauera sp. TaxID=1905334 RepID=UPI0039E3F25B
MQNSQSVAYAEDEIDLRQLVSALWRRKRLIVSAGILGAVLGVGASLQSTRYVTEALFLTPIRSVGEFKRYEGVLTSGARLQQFLQSSGQSATPDAQILHALASNPERFRKSLKPQISVTDKDQKEFGIAARKEDELPLVLGILLLFEHDQPTNGAPIVLLSEYVRESIIRVGMEAVLLSQCTSFRKREQELRNAQIQNDFAIRQDESRITNLRRIVALNPDAGIVENRQIVSLEKGTERFLSPSAQLVAAEIEVADMKLAEVRRKRDRVSSGLKRDYYCRAQQALQHAASGRVFLEGLRDIQAEVFLDHDKQLDIVEQTWNELDVERENWIDTYLLGMRFIAPPEGSEIKQRRSSMVMGGVLGGILGGMFGMLLALVHAWWRGNDDGAAGEHGSRTVRQGAA